jgi:hypothetical protein
MKQETKRAASGRPFFLVRSGGIEAGECISVRGGTSPFLILHSTFFISVLVVLRKPK